jgi:hypothetical protein
MNQRKITTSLIIAVMAGLMFFGAAAGATAAENLLSTNHRFFPDVPEDAELSRQLALVRAATARYHDVNNALEDGFVPLNGLCHNAEGGAVGITYINIPRFLSPEVNPEEPEFMNYFPTGDGNVRLVGIAYGNRALFRDTRPPETPGYRPGIFAWQQPVIPPYLQEVSGPYALFGQPAHPVFEGRWLYLFTLWLWAPNPDGIFADGNPSLVCPENN